MSTKLNVDSIIDGSIHLVKLNEEVTNAITNIAENKAAAAVGTISPTVDALVSDHVIGKGDAEHSAVLKGGNNQVISESGVALGEDNLVGLKGWYYSSIYKENNNTISVYLSKEQKSFNSDEDFKTESQIADTSLPNLVDILGVNAVISLVNAGKYDDKFIVIGGSNGVVRLQTIDESELPFYKITGQSVINYEDYSIYCLSKPDAGISDLGKYSFAVGYNNKATNGESTAFGYNNHAYGKFSFVEGKDNKAGYASHAEGRSNIASGSISHAEGRNNVASGYLSHAEGGYNIAEGAESHAEGYYTIARGAHSHAEGTETIADGLNSHAEGYKTQASGYYSHAEGNDTKAIGNCAHAEGNYTKAEGINSHAEGNNSDSLGPHSHAEGNETRAEGSCAHAEGYKTQALGKFSHAEGNNTISKNEAEHACGKYNLSNSDTRFSIGIGTAETDRKNAHEITTSGKHYILGVGGYDGTKLDGATDVATYLPNMVEITYEELKNLRDNSQLVPGQQYRIIDYVTVSNQKDTEADGRQFDIIVTADDSKTLNENARAIHHVGSTDFEGENLAAWELKYTLTNDDRLYHWGNSGDRIESYYCYLCEDCQISDVIGDKIECESITYTVYKHKKYAFNGKLYHRLLEDSNYYVEVNYKNGDYVYYGEIYYELKPSFITDEKLTFRGYDYYKLNRYSDFYVRSDYATSKYIYDFYDECWDEYTILSINGDKIEYGYYGEESYGEYTIDKSQIITLSGEEYYGVLEDSYYYVPINYSVGSYVYYCEGMCNQYAISSVTNTPSTKGVIYYMKDEFNNECPYDFKSIRFLDGDKYKYTFGDNCYNNVIRPYCHNSNVYLLNFIMFGDNCHNNNFGDGCYSNSFGDGCYSNSFGNYCYNNSFGNYCHNNSFGNYCHNNSFDNNCYSNSFGNNYSSNMFYKSCCRNSFGNYCSSNKFGDSCHSNSFGNNCTGNKSRNNCTYNSFGNYCSSNIFGNYCTYNSFGNYCYSNKFGDYCYSNSFGNNCESIQFVQYSTSNAVGYLATDSNRINYCYNNHFGDGCSYIRIYDNKATSSSSQSIRNYNFSQGVNYGKYSYINIKAERGAPLYETKVGYDTNGNIKVYCESDLTKLLSNLDSAGCLTLSYE